jgi:alkylation response protein AidB-like acyl-CoA dehydrogenase
MAALSMTDCEVSEDALLGAPGNGMAIFNSVMDWERGFIVAPLVGTMQRQLERCIDYARERHQFGKPIGKFEAVSSRIVDMKVRHETSRLLLYRLAWLRQSERRTTTESALTKLHISECAVQSSLDAIQVHGGYGYLSDLGLERDLRDAVASRIYSGTSEIQRSIIARGLGL